MSDIRIEGWSQEDFDQLIQSARRAISLAIKYTATEVWGNIREEAPVDHGRLAGSFQLDQVDDLSYRIWSGVEYALAVHEGTKPHVIEPKNKKALYWDGARHPVRRVMHPGTPGNPYAERAIEQASNRSDEFISRALREVGL